MEPLKTGIRNPILKGFNPDPCMLRVGDIYYIVVSSFEWLPGVRVYQSFDLVHWEHLTDLITDQVDLRGNPKNCSIWAPQLSYQDGLFYLIYSDVKSTKRPFKDVHNYLITATHIEGPWSEPVYLNSSGFDPSLFHDEDGRKWLVNVLWDYRIPEGNKSSGIVIQEFDARKNQLIGEPTKLFDGTWLKKTEAPHLYKQGGYYYLITAEGGTGSGHAVTVARSKHLLGPYEVDPHNPMLTSRDRPDLPLQCAGHGSLVQTPKGEWYMAHLCTRPVEGQYAILGRETALQQVYWDDGGWLRLTGGGNSPFMVAPAPEGAYAPDEDAALLEAGPQNMADSTYIFEDSFDSPVLQKAWNSLRILADDSWCSLVARPGYLRIVAGESPQSLFNHHILAFRQRDIHFRAETELQYEPSNFLQMAGLLLYLNEDKYLYAYVSREPGLGKLLRIMRCEEEQFTLSPESISLKEELPVQLAFEGKGAEGQFYYRQDEEAKWLPLSGTQPIGFLSGGFTGNFVGIAAHDMGLFQGSYADFSKFKYLGYDG